MRKLSFACLIAVLAVGLVAAPAALVAKPVKAGEANAAHLYLYQKNPADWTIVQGGAWGKMRYRPEASVFDFVFNGHMLVTEQAYTLLYYPDPWPGTGLICLGIGMADDWGNVHIVGKIATGSLPTALDQNSLADPSGAKIWLVLSADVDCEGQTMVGWNPTGYLFEKNLITFEAE